MSPNLWTRRLWMRLAVINALSGLIVALLAFRVDDPGIASLLRIGAALQIAHGLAVFACSTFIDGGAVQARHAPAPFLVGSALFAGSLYGRALNIWDAGDIPFGLGGALMAAGWGVLFVACSGLDRSD